MNNNTQKQVISCINEIIEGWDNLDELYHISDISIAIDSLRERVKLSDTKAKAMETKILTLLYFVRDLK